MLKASVFKGSSEDRDFMQRILEEIPLRVFPEQLFVAEMPFKNSGESVPEACRNVICVYPRYVNFQVFDFMESADGNLQVREARDHERTLQLSWEKNGNPPVDIIIHFKPKS